MSMLLTTVGGMSDVLATVATAIPNPQPIQPPGTDGFMSVMSWGKWVALAVCVLALIAVGVLMAIPSRRSEGGEHVGNIGKVLMGVIVISAAAAVVGFLADA